MSRPDDLERIRTALLSAADVLARFSPARVGVTYKAANSPVTDADLAADEILRRELPREGEGWLSEESADDPARLACRRVWIVDPLDGTREFLEGSSQWGVSIGLSEDGRAAAGGFYNPTTDELFLGARETGVTLNGQPVSVSARTMLAGAVVIANRWALRRRPEEWREQPFGVHVVNALAYALALIAAGRADATWSRSPKAEWDTAAGVALISAAGGRATTFDGSRLRFNAWPPRAPGIIASNGAMHGVVRRMAVARTRPRRR